MYMRASYDNIFCYRASAPMVSSSQTPNNRIVAARMQERKNWTPRCPHLASPVRRHCEGAPSDEQKSLIRMATLYVTATASVLGFEMFPVEAHLLAMRNQVR